MRRLWPDTFVDDSSLPQLMMRLRRTLAEHDPAVYIETIPKRGYRLAQPVEIVAAPATHDPSLVQPESAAVPVVTTGSGTSARRRVLAGWLAVAALAGLGVAGLSLARVPGTATVAASVDADLREARRLWHKRDDISLRESQELVSRVLQQDPRSARAHAQLADLMALRLHAGAEARAAAERALALEPASAEAHASLGFVHMAQDWNWAAAGPLFERAVALDARLPHARQWLAVWRALTGDSDGARAEIARARDLDPLAAHLLAETAGIEYFARHYRDAIVWASRALAADPHFSYAYNWWESAARQAGLTDEALEVRHARITFLSRRALDPELEQSLRAGGIPALVAHEQRGRVPSPANAWSRAVQHAQLGETDEALAALDEAIRHRNFLCIYLGVEPALDGLRAHPAFPDLLARVGLARARTTPD